MNQNLSGENPGKTETQPQGRPMSRDQTVALNQSLTNIASIGRIVDREKRYEALMVSGRKLGFVRPSD